MLGAFYSKHLNSNSERPSISYIYFVFLYIYIFIHFYVSWLKHSLDRYLVSEGYGKIRPKLIIILFMSCFLSCKFISIIIIRAYFPLFAQVDNYGKMNECGKKTNLKSYYVFLCCQKLKKKKKFIRAM